MSAEMILWLWSGVVVAIAYYMLFNTGGGDDLNA